MRPLSSTIRRSEVDTLAVKKKEFEAFDERVRALQGSVGDAESRMEALSAKDKNLISLGQKVDGLTKRFDALFAQADDLTKKQLALDTLHEQLGQVDELAKRTVVADGLAQAEPPGSRRRCARRFRTSTSRTPRSSSSATSWAPIAWRSRRSASG